MYRPLILILAVAGVLLQSLPLRACAVEQAITGHSCHDTGAAVAIASAPCSDSAFDGHVSPNSRPHDSSCRCELPKGSMHRLQLAAVLPVDLYASIDVLNADVLSIQTFRRATPPDFPRPAVPNVSLPLLN